MRPRAEGVHNDNGCRSGCDYVRRRLRVHRLLVRHDGRRRRLHRLHDERGDAVLLQIDDVVGRQRPDQTMVADVRGNDLLVHPGLSHRDDVGNGHRSGGSRPAESGSDFGSIAGFDIVDGAADNGSRHRAGHGSDRGAGERITGRGSGDGTESCAHYAAEQGSTVGRVR